MSGAADDGADRLEQVMQKHLGSTLPRKPSVGKGRASRELEDEPTLPATQEKAESREGKEVSDQVQ